MQYKLTEKRIKVRKHHKCFNCNILIKKKQLAYNIKIVYFPNEEEKISTESIYTCGKCMYKINKKNKRVEKRKELAKNGFCKEMKKELYSWSNGSLLGGDCQVQCRECEINCTFSKISSF